MESRFLAVVFHVLVRVLAGAPDYHLELLPENLAKTRGAQCLDHSPAGYYIRQQDPNKWVIFLEGGGLCVTQWDCIFMRKDSQMGSSKNWHPTKTRLGPSCTSTSSRNPLQNYSHIYLPYCSGDMWLGGSPEGHFHLGGLQMSGHLILDTIVDQLISTTSFGSAKDIVLAGTSAGGISVYHHVDWLADKMASFASSSQQTAPQVSGLAIAGMFFPKRWPIVFEAFIFGGTDTSDFMNWYLRNLEWPWLHPGCVEASKKKGFREYSCLDVSNMLPYVKTPVFTAMNRFDDLQIKGLGLSLCKGFEPHDSDCGRFIRYFGSVMNETVLEASQKYPQHGWFIPNEYAHDFNFYWFFEGVEKAIQGVSLRAAYESWKYGNRVLLLETTCDHHGPCKNASDGNASVLHFFPPLTRDLSVAATGNASRIGDHWLVWILLGILLLCLVSCCLALLAYFFKASTKRGTKRSTRTAPVQEVVTSAPHQYIAQYPVASKVISSSTPPAAATPTYYIPLRQTPMRGP